MALPDTSFDPDAPAEGDGLYGLPHTPAEAEVVVVPVPWEATTSYRRGTAGGPAAVLEASAQVDLHDVLLGDFWRRGIAMEPVDDALPGLNERACALALPVIDAGGPATPELEAACAEVNALSARVNAIVRGRVEALLAAGKVPAVLGGDHSVPYGAMAAASERHPGLGVLHLDAHADLRLAYEGFTHSHASIFRNVRELPGVGNLVQVGIRDVAASEHAFIDAREDIRTYFDAHLARELAGGEPWRRLCERIVGDLPEQVWVSFDIDGLDPSLCPNTGTPVPGGLSFREMDVLLATLVESGRTVVGFDLCEVAAEEWDAIVGARVLYRLAGWALRSRGPERG